MTTEICCPVTFTAVVADIPPGTDVSYEWSASDGSTEYDVSGSAVFTPNGSGEVARARDSLTVIRLELQAVYEAPENPCTNRHVYGVGEKVRLIHYPHDVSVSWDVGCSDLNTELVDDSDCDKVAQLHFRADGDANGTFAPVVYADSAVRGEWRSTLLALHCSASLFPNDLWRDMIPFGVAGDLI